MLRYVHLRLAVSVVLACTLLPAVAFAQSQDSQSVADAARRAREQKKAAQKPAKVITEDDVKPATPAAPEPAAAPGAPPSSASGTANPSAGPSGASAAAPNATDEQTAKEIAALKEQIKQAQSDLDLAKRQLSLEEDTYFSNSDYTHATAEKAKVDGFKQQASDKQLELDRLKTRLVELQPVPPAPPVAPAPAAPPQS